MGDPEVCAWRNTMLDWFRQCMNTPIRVLPRLPEVVDEACVHVQSVQRQVNPFEGRLTDRVPL